MAESGTNLGICFFSNRLFYAVNNADSPRSLKRIGAFDFNFNVIDAVSSQHPGQLENLVSALSSLCKKFGIRTVYALTYPSYECWSILPKIVYDDPDEREDHINILMQAVEREDIEPTWHSISNNDFKLLQIRRRSIMKGFERLCPDAAYTEFLSDFELSARWEKMHKNGGSFLMIGSHQNLIAVTSCILGKLRAATYIEYDSIDDLPYLWLQKSSHLSWLKGIHEHIFLYGDKCFAVSEIMQGIWDEASTVTKLNSLKDIGVEAQEETYGFDLAAAFPAIVLALDL